MIGFEGYADPTDPSSDENTQISVTLGGLVSSDFSSWLTPKLGENSFYSPQLNSELEDIWDLNLILASVPASPLGSDLSDFEEFRYLPQENEAVIQRAKELDDIDVESLGELELDVGSFFAENGETCCEDKKTKQPLIFSPKKELKPNEDETTVSEKKDHSSKKKSHPITPSFEAKQRKARSCRVVPPRDSIPRRAKTKALKKIKASV